MKSEQNEWVKCNKLNALQSQEIIALNDRIKRLEEAGNELRWCASRIGTVASGEGSVIRRTEEAIQTWAKAKEAKQ